MAGSLDQSVWGVLLPVLVGGGLAMMGTVVGPLVSLWWNARQNRQQKEEQRLEAVLSSLYDFDYWIDQRGNELLSGSIPPHGGSPLAKVRLIVQIGFPQISSSLLEFEVAAKRYEHWMLQRAQSRLKGADFNTDGLGEAHGEFKTALSKFEQVIVAQARS